MDYTNTTLFVVDDDSAARNSIAALATATGVPAETYSSAEDFLERYIPGRPGCVVADLRLPGMSGLELHERLTQNGASIPVILVSAHLTIPLVVRAMQDGIFTALEKPYPADQLLQMVGSAIKADQQSRAQRSRLSEYRTRLDALHPRERRTVELITAGMPNKSIAREIGVSQRTVDRIRAAILEKMGVQSSVELVRLVSSLDLPLSTQYDAPFSGSNGHLLPMTSNCA